MRRNLIFAVVALILVVFLFLPVVRPRQELGNAFLGKGVWIYGISDTERGNVEVIAKKAEWAGLDHILVKTHDGGTWWHNDKRALQALIQACHRRKIIVFAWGYVYGRRWQAETKQAIASLEMPFDGYVCDIEAEYKGKPDRANRMAAQVEEFRDRNYPGKKLGYSSFSKTFNQPNVPYLELGRHTDYAMPQDYWAVFGTRPAATLARMCERWATMEAAWRQAGFGDSVKPIIPTGQIVDHHSRKVPASELAEFLFAGRRYYGINVWRWDLMSKGHWDALRAFEPEKRPMDVLSAHRRAILLPWWLKFWLLGAVAAMLVGIVLRVGRGKFDWPLPMAWTVICCLWPIVLAVFAGDYGYRLYRRLR